MLKDMSRMDPRAMLSISANLELIDATGREFCINYTSSLEVSMPLYDA